MKNINQLRLTLQLAGMEQEICLRQHQWQEGEQPPAILQQILGSDKPLVSDGSSQSTTTNEFQRTIAVPMSPMALHLQTSLEGVVAVTARQARGLVEGFDVPRGGKGSVLSNALRGLGFQPASKAYKIAKLTETVYFRSSEVSEKKAVAALRYTAI